MSTRSHLVACLLALGIALNVPTRASAQAPQLEVELLTVPMIIHKDFYRAYGIWLSFVASTPHSEEEFAEFFPADAFGGTRSECGYGSVDGIALELDQPVTWTHGQIFEFGGVPPLILTPSLWYGLFDGTTRPIVVDSLRVLDPVMEQLFRFDGRTTRSRTVEAWAEDSTAHTGWRASVSVDCFCVYRSGDDEVLGTLRSADVGGSTLLVAEEGHALPVIVPTQPTTWSAIKSSFKW